MGGGEPKFYHSSYTSLHPLLTAAFLIRGVLNPPTSTAEGWGGGGRGEGGVFSTKIQIYERKRNGDKKGESKIPVYIFLHPRGEAFFLAHGRHLDFFIKMAAMLEKEIPEAPQALKVALGSPRA